LLQAAHDELLDYQIRLSASTLPSLLTSLLSNHSATISADLFTYYCSNPQLYDYTLSKELSRLSYTFISPDGSSSSSPFELLKYPPLPSSRLYHLISCANQSLLAPLLTLLYSAQFTPILLPSKLNDANYIVTKTSFTVNPTHLTALTTVDVHVPHLHLSTLQFSLSYTGGVDSLRVSVAQSSRRSPGSACPRT
jgi:hypothetical protein